MTRFLVIGKDLGAILQVLVSFYSSPVTMNVNFNYTQCTRVHTKTHNDGRHNMPFLGCFPVWSNGCHLFPSMNHDLEPEVITQLFHVFCDSQAHSHHLAEM